MIKSLLLLTVILFVSFDGVCNSLSFKWVNGWGGYLVRGKVDANMIKSKDFATWGRFYVSVHETGQNYYMYTSNDAYCPDSATGAAEFINERLSKGVNAITSQKFIDNTRNWTASVYCMSGPAKTWMTVTTLPSLPGSADCSITYPANVSFGNVTLGSVKDINSEIKITCDAPADVKVSFSKDMVELSDAEMNYYFPDNKKTHNVSVDLNHPANFNVRFSLEKTGNTLGYKTGDAVMLFSWQ